MLSAAYKMGEQEHSPSMKRKSSMMEIGKSLKSGKTMLSGSHGISKFERDFVMLEPIGQGEFSTVWKVRDKRTGGLWAVKRGKPFIGLKDR